VPGEWGRVYLCPVSRAECISVRSAGPSVSLPGQQGRVYLCPVSRAECISVRSEGPSVSLSGQQGGVYLCRVYRWDPATWPEGGKAPGRSRRDFICTITRGGANDRHQCYWNKLYPWASPGRWTRNWAKLYLNSRKIYGKGGGNRSRQKGPIGAKFRRVGGRSAVQPAVQCSAAHSGRGADSNQMRGE
jgi:hypothetical protein